MKDFEIIDTAYREVLGAFGKGAIGELYWIVALIAVLIIISKFINCYKEAFTDNDKPANIKHFFNLFGIYVYTIIVILTAPVVFNVFEQGLLVVEKSLAEKGNEIAPVYLDASSLESNSKFIEEFNKRWEEQEEREAKNRGTFANIINDFNPLKYMAVEIMKIFHIAINRCNAYLIYLFALGRYLWLILLHLVMPFAIVLYLDDKTKQYTYTWLKNLFHCYLIIPALFIANAFADKVLSLFSTENPLMYGNTSANFLIITLILKWVLFSKAIRFTKELI